MHSLHYSKTILPFAVPSPQSLVSIQHCVQFQFFSPLSHIWLRAMGAIGSCCLGSCPVSRVQGWGQAHTVCVCANGCIQPGYDLSPLSATTTIGADTEVGETVTGLGGCRKVGWGWFVQYHCTGQVSIPYLLC